MGAMPPRDRKRDSARRTRADVGASGVTSSRVQADTASKAKRTSKRRQRRVVARAGRQGATVSISVRDSYLQAQWKSLDGARRRCLVAGFKVDPNGALTKEQGTILQNLASLLHQHLELGRKMPGEAGGPSWDVLLRQATPKRKGQDEKPTKPVLTVREVLAKVYGPSYADQLNRKGRISGKFVHSIKNTATDGRAVSTWTRHARDLRRTADVIEGILGSESPWDPSQRTFLRLRDALIARVRKTADHTSAPKRMRRVHKALQTFLRATREIAAEYEDSADPERPRPLTLVRWRTHLRQAWSAAELSTPAAAQPRYLPNEAGRIYVEATSGRHDPRYALWALLGLEGRPSQILKSRRSGLCDEYPGTVRGIFRGPGTDLKHGLTYAPMPAHWMEIETILTEGYLRHLEAAYQAKRIRDYPLYPSILVNGVAPVRPDLRPWGYRQFLGNPHDGTGYYALERAAGVETREGRGPYAFKYMIADLAPSLASQLGIADAAVVNLVTAHDTPGTTRIYRQSLRDQAEILTAVGRIIWSVRKTLRDHAMLARAEALGIQVGGDHIRKYSIEPDGARIITLKGAVLWVPWVALGDGEGDPDAIEQLINSRGLFEPATVDDDAKNLEFPALRIKLNLDHMLLRAARNRARDPDNPALNDLKDVFD